MMLFKMAWRNLWRNRRRTLITAASVFFAVLLATWMSSFQEGSYGVMVSNMVNLYTGYAQVHKTGYWANPVIDNSFENKAAVQDALDAHPALRQAAPRLESFALVSSGQNTREGLVVGVDPAREDAFTQLSKRVVEGQYFSEGGPVVMLGSELARRLGVQTGDTVVLISAGYRGAIAGGRYRVGALLRFGAPELNARMLYLPLPEAQEMYAAEGNLSAYALDLKNPDQLPQLVAELRQQLGEGYEVLPWQEMMPEMAQYIKSDRAGGQIFLIVLYILIGFGIFGTVLMMSAERRYEWGMLMAIGMKRGQLALMMLYEMLLMGLLGTLAGSAASLPLVWYFKIHPIEFKGDMAKVFEEFGMEPIMPTLISGEIFLNQALLVLGMTLLIFLYPWWNIRRLDPVRAMRA